MLVHALMAVMSNIDAIHALMAAILIQMLFHALPVCLLQILVHALPVMSHTDASSWTCLIYMLVVQCICHCQVMSNTELVHGHV